MTSSADKRKGPPRRRGSGKGVSGAGSESPAGGGAAARDWLAEYVEKAGLDRAAAWSLRDWLSEQLVADEFANLGQGGHTENRVPLRRVFVDLPVTEEPFGDAEQHDPEAFFLRRLRKARPFPLKWLSQKLGAVEGGDWEGALVEGTGEGPNSVDVPEVRAPEAGFLSRRGSAPPGRDILVGAPGVLLIGGPGQGKSTLGQLACQLHRVALLRPRVTELTSHVREVLEPFEAIDQDVLAPVDQEALSPPEEPLFPLRIVLPEASAWLSRRGGIGAGKSKNDASEVPALARFVADLPSARKAGLGAEILLGVLARTPFFLLLDGFDEVGSAADRERIVEETRALLVWLGAKGGRAVVVATTRPQGYAGELERIGVPLETQYLATLSQDQALGYAAKLLKAKTLGADRQQDQLTKIRSAARDPVTARLLRTPLQVTILAALVEQQGRPPSERWSLFWSYFDFTYRREIERDTYASELLRQRRAHIQAIHARAALLLQAEAESSGGAASRLSRERLQEIADTVLQEDEVADDERADLVRSIVDAAEKRLVFLVEPEPGAFGFEIRSLQEFFAAWALSDGREPAVEERLVLAARGPMFRNVVLFMASRLFGERLPLRDVLADRVCGAVEGEAADPLARTTRAGAMLALEMLEEGAALPQPKRARALMQRACELLDLPPGVEHVRLARVANEDTAPVLRESVEGRFARAVAGEPVSLLASWACVVEGANQGQSWALDVGEERLAAERDPVRVLDACRRAGVILGRWIVSKIEARPEAFPPESLAGLRTDVEPWARASRQSWVDVAVGRPYLRVAGFPPSTEGWQYDHRPLPEGGETEQWGALAEMPSPPDCWKAWVAAARFVGRPSASLLAEVLRTASRSLTTERWNSLAAYMPWPLAACLRAADTPEDLERFAKRLDAGELGDAADWYRAEASWRTGSSLRSVLEASDKGVPWSPEYLGSAPPILQVRHMRFAWGRTQRPSQLLPLTAEKFEGASSPAVRRVLADMAFTLLGAAEPRAPSHPPSAFPLQRWAREATTTALDTSSRDLRTRTSEWLAALDTFGSRRLAKTNASRWVLAPLYLKHPENVGVLYWMTTTLPVGGEHMDARLSKLREATRETLEQQSYPTPATRADAAVLRAWVGSVTPATADQILDTVAAWADQEPVLWRRLLESTRNGFLPDPVRELLCLQAYRRMGPDHPFAPYAMETLRALLQKRVSGLAARPTWDRLELPLPYPAATPSSAAATALPDKPIVLRRLHVQHLRALADLDFRLAPPSPDRGQWIVLLGPNGSGKTTLLRGLALALRNLTDPVIWPDGAFYPPWCSNTGPKEAKIHVDVESYGPQDTLIRTNGSETFKQTPVQETPRLFPLFAYGCRRGSALGGPQRAVNLEDDGGPEVATLFGEGAPLIHAQTWLLTLDSDAARKPEARNLLDVVLAALASLLGVDSVEIRDKDVWVSSPAVGQSIRLAALSDGYLTTAGWFLDLIARWIRLAERHRVTVAPDFLGRMTGLVLVDEIDLHLHPRWQVDVITRARALLPRMSFVVTTHNPLTLVGARPEEIWVLNVEGGKVRAEQGKESPMLLTGGQLFSRYFGIRDVYPNELGQKLRRYSFLSGYPLRTDAEQAELLSLREELKKAGIETGWEEVPREPLPSAAAPPEAPKKSSKARRKPS